MDINSEIIKLVDKIKDLSLKFEDEELNKEEFRTKLNTELNTIKFLAENPTK